MTGGMLELDTSSYCVCVCVWHIPVRPKDTCPLGTSKKEEEEEENLRPFQYKDTLLISEDGLGDLLLVGAEVW